MKKLFLLLVSMLFLTFGCSGLKSSNSKAQLITDGEITSIHSPSDNLVTYVKTIGSDIQFCSQTNIDSVKTRSSGISAAVGLSGSTDEVGEQSSVGDEALGGRDSAVLLTRELMYRACELMSNANLEKEDAIKVYAATLDAVIKISLSQTATGTKALDAEPQVHPIILPSVGNSSQNSKQSMISTGASAKATGSADNSSIGSYDYNTPQHYQ